MKYAIAFAAICCLPMAGCSIPHSKSDGGPVGTYIVSPGDKVLVLNIADGQEQGQSPAPGSGQGMVDAIRRVLTAHAVPLSITESGSLDAGFDEARRIGARYVLKTTITLWEDNATAWSGKGDKLNISCQLYSANSHELLAASDHRRVATGFTFVSGTPDRFMDEVAFGALGKLYGWSPKS